LKKLAEGIRSGKLNDEFVIQKTDMAVEDIAIIKVLLFREFDKWDNFHELAEKISEELPNYFGGNWHCIVYRKSLGAFSVHHNNKCYINFSVSDLNFTIYQSPSE